MKYYILFLCMLTLSTNLLLAQCGNQDADIWKDTWQSCQTTQNPNEIRGVGHWIMYDLGEVYQLSKTHIWNSNEAGKTDVGFKNVVIDYSTNGSDWSSLGQYKFPQGNGEAVYGGFEGFDFEGKDVRYVLITAIDNWGNVNCSGLAEVKFNISGFGPSNVTTSVEEELSPLSFELYPNPVQDEFEINIQVQKPIKIEITITDIMGKEIDQFMQKLRRGENSIEVELEELNPGIYFVRIEDEDNGRTKTKRVLFIGNE